MTTIQRYTAEGGSAVEAEARRITAAIADVAQATVPARALRALVLLGGYGRGEGGVEVRGGRECLHNNLDLLLILNAARGSDHAAIATAFERALDPIRADAGVGIDVGLITARQLRRAPCLVMWYDMHHGHRTLAGDAAFVPALTRFRADRIVRSDLRNLLVNRATLLTLNDFLLDARPGDPAIRRAVIRHAMKAIIGYGDALLAANRAYHWSYREKQRRITTLDAPSDFKRLHALASEFRFVPTYDRWLSADLAAWMEELRVIVEPIHRKFEAWRLRRPLPDWSAYWPAAVRHSAIADVRARAAARRAWDIVRHRSGDFRPHLSRAERALWHWIGLRELLPLVAPTVLYDLQDGGARSRATAILAADTEDIRALRRGYLACWGRVGDPNFAAALDRFAITLHTRKAA